MLNTINTRAAEVGDTFVRASRQFWLAGLGAAVVTRDWAEKEGGVVFRNLVREGTAMESRAIRYKRFPWMLVWRSPKASSPTSCRTGINTSPWTSRLAKSARR